jgi:hypothetical protein
MEQQASAQPSPAPDITLHFLDEAGVLFDASRRRLFRLNTTAAYIWCCLEEGQSRGTIQRGLEETFGLTPKLAASHLDGIFSDWAALGLLRDSDDGLNTQSIHLQLLDTVFTLTVRPAELANDLTDLLEPLTVSPAGNAVPLVVERDAMGFSVRMPGDVVERCHQREELAPLLKICLARLALQHSRDLCSLHAAGVALNGKCLLLPGPSGIGKSTLAAALTLEGLPLLGDDTIVLAEEEPVLARPMPFSICLKPGAWELLGHRLPGLAQRATHKRPDGKRVRYLVPPRLCDGTSMPVGWIVFPQRRATISAELVPIERAEALSRLLGESCPLGDPLDAARVARLVAWISRIPCFELHFCALPAAVERLRRLAS